MEQRIENSTANEGPVRADVATWSDAKVLPSAQSSVFCCSRSAHDELVQAIAIAQQEMKPKIIGRVQNGKWDDHRFDALMVIPRKNNSDSAWVLAIQSVDAEHSKAGAFTSLCLMRATKTGELHCLRRDQKWVQVHLLKGPYDEADIDLSHGPLATDWSVYERPAEVLADRGVSVTSIQLVSQPFPILAQFPTWKEFGETLVPSLWGTKTEPVENPTSTILPHDDSHIATQFSFPSATTQFDVGIWGVKGTAISFRSQDRVPGGEDFAERTSKSWLRPDDDTIEIRRSESLSTVDLRTVESLPKGSKLFIENEWKSPAGVGTPSPTASWYPAKIVLRVPTSDAAIELCRTPFPAELVGPQVSPAQADDVARSLALTAHWWVAAINIALGE